MAGWKNTKSLGDVYLNDEGKVERATMGEGLTYQPVYPYRLRMVQNGFGEWKSDGWDNCSGCYTPSYLAHLMREGKAKWA